MIGLVQATEILKLAAGIGEPLLNRLLLFNALEMRFREIKIRRDPECPICGEKPRIKSLIDYEVFCGTSHPAAPMHPDEVTVQDMKHALDHPELYELLFGRVLWKAEGPESESFRARARASFRGFAEVVKGLQAKGWLSPDLDPLRLAQVMWSTLHGLCCMYNDGLAFSPGDVAEISQYARWLVERMQSGRTEAEPAK